MKRLLCLSDIHPGSIDGLLPSNFNSEDGRLVGQNVGQKYTWECWQHMIEWAATKKPDGIVINGDVVEGKQFKGHGGELCLPRVIDQEQASIEILAPLFSACKPKKVYFVKGCLLPGHKVLTRNLTWVPVETLRPGDKLLSVSDRHDYQWTDSEVLVAKPVAKECCEVRLENGRRIRCTVDHPLLVWNGTTRTWTEAGKLKAGVSRIALALEPWSCPDTYKTGWLAGFLDSEGTLAQRNGGWGQRATLAAYQRDGAVLARASDYFAEAGFDVAYYPAKSGVSQLHIKGGFPETVRALGMLRPARMLGQFRPNGRYLRNSGYVKVTEIRKLGVVNEVVGLSTSTGTYIADGFVHHNTFYHDDEMGRSVDNIAHHFKTEKYEGLGIGRYAREVLDLNVEGVLCDFSHGISVSGGLYRAVALDREMLWATLAEKMNQTPRADVIVRAHAHYFVHIEHSAKHGVILPAWQLQTSFMRKHSRYRMIPDLGAAMIEIDGEAKKRGEDPCRIEKRLYALPPHRIAHF